MISTVVRRHTDGRDARARAGATTTTHLKKLK
jgi:hypothetical protein